MSARINPLRKKPVGICNFLRCRAKGTHVVPMGDIHRRGNFSICGFHYRICNAVNRPRFWSRRKDPKIKGIRVESGHPIYGYHVLADRTIYLTQYLAVLDPKLVVYGITHEYMHHLLCRDFGLLTSLQLDLIENKSIRCLRGHSIRTYLIAELYRKL